MSVLTKNRQQLRDANHAEEEMKNEVLAFEIDAVWVQFLCAEGPGGKRHSAYQASRTEVQRLPK